MNLILMRHGEATDNVKGLISDKEIYWSVLTDNGRNTCKEAVKSLPDNINKVYVSPLPRTIQTANFIYLKYPNIEFILEPRIKEIQYGKYSHCENNSELDSVRKKQIAGDYFIRFGETGDNKFDIEMRLTNFLIDLYNMYKNNETIVVVTHGSISSYIKRLLSLQTTHLEAGKVEIFNDIDFTPVINNMRLLNNLNNDTFI